MMSWKLTTILSFLICMSAHASLYQCTEENGKPFKVEDSQQPIIHYEKVSPHSFEEAKMVISGSTKTPYLIYYVVDSTEPFMQLSVKYELAELKKSCLASRTVNFAALVNSLYVKENSIIVCKDKKFSKINLKRFVKLNQSLIQKRKFLLEGDHTAGQMGPLKYLVHFDEIAKLPFYESPLAHPDFLHDLVNLVMTDKILFPSNTYLPFLNLKSHGSAKTVLSGLYSCQTKAKTLTQETIVKALPAEEIKALDDLLTDKVTPNKDMLEMALKKLHLDKTQGRGSLSTLGDQALGDQALGDQALGDQALSNTIFGLGADDGLGSSSAFGVRHAGLNAVLGDLFNKQNQRYLGFLMLESCETKREVAFNHSNLHTIGGLYTARYSLWYRNLNWWDILSRANNSSKELVNLIEQSTSKINNLDFVK